jgi:uncharacterized membrane protein
MKKILKNLIPPAFYWITFAVGFFIVLVFDLPTGYWYHALLAVMIIVNFLVGSFVNAKQIKWGILALFIQLLLSGIIQIALIGKSEYPTFFDFGNFVMSGVFYYDSATPLIVEIFRLIASLIFIIAPFFIGSAIKNRAECKKQN